MDYNFADISGFSPEEQAALNYHRANLINNTYLRHPEGGITTFMGSVVPTPDRKREMIIPTYWGGSIRQMPEAYRSAIKSNITWPSYPTAKEALEAEQRMHKIMEEDTKLFESAQSKKGKK